ncbi:MAG: hypothetical protein IJN37_01805 [Clostridia bacterium]|nr:hypothetical protein [Clostridia bacterium]
MSKYLSPKRSKKSIATLVSLILILTIGVGGTLAYLITSTGEVKNTFTPSQVNISVNENVDNGVKSNVKIQNHNDSVKAYIRAAIVVNWMDKDGNVWAAKPKKDTDYTMTTGGNWTLGTDGYYYHKGAVEPNADTNVLITEAKYLANAPDGYYLSIEILAQAIQADGVDSEGKSPVELAWGPTAAGLVE